MSPRREALLGRFRASALDRIERLRVALGDARNTGSPLTGALGDLHTIKGESRMLGLAAMARFTHAVEQGLAGEPDGDALEGAERAAALLERALRGEVDGEWALAQAADLLEAGGLGAFDASAWPASVEPLPQDAPPETAERWTRVEAGRVDRVCDLVNEVGWLFDRLQAQLQVLSKETGAAPALRTLLDETERALPRVRELETSAWTLRLVPVEPELRELARHGQELAAQADKGVRFVLEASGTQLERQVLDGLAEPLLHLVRNAVDHGVEPAQQRGDKPAEATVRIMAASAGPWVVLSVEDDGRGLDPETLRAAAVERGLLDAAVAGELAEERLQQLVFEPGFSTRRAVSEVSGRGVGLDVVRRRVEEVGGTVRVDSMAGAGTRFEVRVPATITRERFVVVASEQALYGVPARLVRRIGRRNPEEEETVAGGRVVRDGEVPVPLRVLDADLGQPDAVGGTLLLWVESGSERWAWAVRSVLGERDLVRRALDPVLADVGVLSGSALLEDGRLVLLLRVSELRRRASRQAGRVAAAPERERAAARALVVDDSPIIRDLLAELLRDAGLTVETACDGREAMERVDLRAPDLVITDLEMPRMDGFALVEAIRQRGLQLPVIVVTTRGSEEDRRRASHLGANAYVVKTGFEGSALLETVARFVDVHA